MYKDKIYRSLVARCTCKHGEIDYNVKNRELIFQPGTGIFNSKHSVNTPEGILYCVGTFGCIGLTDKKQEVILSNSHVIANLGRAEKGEKIDLYSEYYDPSKSSCQKTNGKIVRSNQFRGFEWGSTFKKPVEPKIDMKVTKSGWKTGVTHGKILDTCTDVNVDLYYVIDGKLEKQTSEFIDIIKTTKMAEIGDSGSLLLTDNYEPLGLIFAGDKDCTLTCKMTNMFEQCKDLSYICCPI